jgi:hypothetical protein
MMRLYVAGWLLLGGLVLELVARVLDRPRPGSRR